MVEPGTTAEVRCWWDVERVIPHEQYPDLNEHYCRLLEERSAAREEIHGDTDELTDGPRKCGMGRSRPVCRNGADHASRSAGDDRLRQRIGGGRSGRIHR
jgi:hypothetical protein